MRCEMCGKESDHFVMLPIKQSDGRYNTIACFSCAQQSKVYCRKHDMPHLGFYDGTTACRICIEQLVNLKKDDASRILSEIQKSLSPEDFDNLMGWWAETSNITRDTFEVFILRLVVMKALRSKEELEDVLQTIQNERNAAAILPYII